MVESKRKGLLVKHTLTAHELAEIEELAAFCNAHEHLLMRLDYNVLELPLLPTDDLFLFYLEDRLVGCLLLDRYRSDVKEVTAMVHPAFRRQGVFSHLLAAARQECLSRGIRRLLFTCELTAESGQACMRAIGAGREFAEHRMLLEDFRPRLQFDDHLLFREAVLDDQDALAVIVADDMGSSKERAREYVRHAWSRPRRRFYIATYGDDQVGCAEPVGALRVEDMLVEMGIYAFSVRRDYRGRGHGRQILEEAIIATRERSQKPIMLEVDSNNFTALNLYRSCGFVAERTYEYYGLALD